MRALHPELRDVQESLDGYTARWRHLRFVVSECVELDGRKWLHASVSRRGGGMPAYEDLQALKRVCLGEQRWAYQVFPPPAKHIDIAGPLAGVEVLHLWALESGEPVTPDFSQGTGSI